MKKSKDTTRDYINAVANALTHFAFRNGPVEDMHSEGKLSQEDMKTLNKFMVNRLAYAFDLLLSNDDNGAKFHALIAFTNSWYGHDWDKAELDDGDFEKILEEYYPNILDEVSVTKEPEIIKPNKNRKTKTDI